MHTGICGCAAREDQDLLTSNNHCLGNRNVLVQLAIYPHCPLRVVALEDLQQLNTALLPMAGHGMLNQRASALDMGTWQQGSSDSHGLFVLAWPKCTCPDARKAEHWPHP